MQSINDRMNEQDPNVTYSTPKLSNAIERVLKSERQVAVVLRPPIYPITLLEEAIVAQISYILL